MEVIPSRDSTPKWKKLAMTALGLTSAAVLAAGLYSTHSNHFYHHNERLLHEMASSTSIQVQFTTKNASAYGTNGLSVTGQLFPRSSGKDLQFDGRLSYEFLGQQFNFTLVNDRGFVTVEDITKQKMVLNECLKSVNIPPIHLLADALRGARVVDDAETLGMSGSSCEDGKLVEFTFAHEPFVFCSRANGAINKIHGHDLEATIQVLRDNTETAPSLDSLTRPGNKSISECELLTPEEPENPRSILASVHASSGRMLSSMVSQTQDIARVLTGQRRLASTDDCSTVCKDGKKICLFVHGLGKTIDAPVADSYPEAWGDPSQFTCCSQTKFVQMDTVNNAWYSDELSKKVCDAAVELTHSKDPMKLDGIAIISHSMGNLIVASAAARGVCAVGPKSKWIALAGPISGSQSANFGIKACSDNPNSHVDDGVIKTLEAVGVCPSKSSIQSLVYEKSDRSNPELNKRYAEAEAAYTRLVTSSLCGVSSSGIVSVDSPVYHALDIITPHGSDNDGAVEIDSCRASFGETKYQTSWSGGNFYKASINHGDATFRNGDGLWGESRKPVKWLNCQF